MKFVDDVVPTKGRSGPESKDLAEIVRGFFDGTGRMVCGKPACDPQSPLAFSSNGAVNVLDKPFQSRLISIMFEALSGLDDDAIEDPDYSLLRRLMCVVLPDIELIGKYNGTIDVEAIIDCASWLSQVQCVKRYRPVNNSAKLMHMYLNMMRVACARVDDFKEFLRWIVNDVTRAICDLNKHGGLLDQFLLAVIQVRETVGGNLLGPNPDRVIFWHNLRTDASPDSFPVMPNQVCDDENSSSNTGWWAIRVGPVTHVIKTVLGQSFDQAEIYKVAKKNPDVIERSKSIYFADIYKMWPLQQTRIDDSSGTMVNIPLAEHELLECNMSKEQCLMVKGSYIKRLMDSLNGSRSADKEYKSIVVVSCNKTVGRYNLFESVLNGSWFGFRGLAQSSFGQFCGMTNKILSGTGPSADDELMISEQISKETRAAGYVSVMATFTPAFIFEQLSYSIPDGDKRYPPSWLKVPFATRDADGDTPIVDPVDFDAVRTGTLIPEFRRFTTDYHEGDDTLPADCDDTPPADYDSSDGLDKHNDEFENAMGEIRDRVRSPDGQPPTKVRRRASPTNQARYPRPPSQQRTLADAIAWGRYVRAGGPVVRADGPPTVDDSAELEAEAELEADLRGVSADDVDQLCVDDDEESLSGLLADDALDEEQVSYFDLVVK